MITPLGIQLQDFATTSELLDVLADTVNAPRSLYIDSGILHRDLAIKNIVIASDPGKGRNRCVLIDLDSAQNVVGTPIADRFKGSDGFMAVEVLLGGRHTYHTDLQSLFYVFLWLIIGNEREYPHPNIILFNLSESSRLRKWVSKDYYAVAQAKIADMSIQGFEIVLQEVSADFCHLCGSAKELHNLVFRPNENGIATFVTDMSRAAVECLYREMSAALRRQSFLERRAERSLLS